MGAGRGNPPGYPIYIPSFPSSNLSEVLPLLEYMAEIVKDWDVAYWFPGKEEMTSAFLRIYRKYLKERYPQTYAEVHWPEYQDLIEISQPLNPQNPTD